jgi:hypothetical protein
VHDYDYVGRSGAVWGVRVVVVVRVLGLVLVHDHA